MPQHNHFPTSTTAAYEADVSHEHMASEATDRNMGKRILFRVMNLDNHSGVQHRAEDGTVVYQVDNLQYPDQGDFAFGNHATGFQEAVTRAYPRHLHNVHAVEVDAEHVVEPYPDEAPGLVYIENGATATAKPVPREVIDAYSDNPSTAPDDVSRQVAEQLFPRDAA